MHQVEHYGLHWDGPVAWLVQGRGGNNFVGLKAQVPFHVKSGMCNHLIPAAAPNPDRIHWEKFLTVFGDPLVQAMLPLPRPPGKTMFYVNDPEGEMTLHLSLFSRLSSPIQAVVKPAGNVKVRDLEKDLSQSNLQPLVLVQASAGTQAVVDAIAQFSMILPRTVIIAGSPDVVMSPPMRRITTKITSIDLQDMMTLPLESIGAALLRRHARHEPLDAPMETRQDRRDRQIRERS